MGGVVDLEFRAGLEADYLGSVHRRGAGSARNTRPPSTPNGGGSWPSGSRLRRRRADRTASGSRSSTLRRSFAGTDLTVQQARGRRFRRFGDPRGPAAASGSRGTGPATRPRSSVASGLRNVAYALLSGADGWMFDGEDALGPGRHDVARQPAQPQAGDPPRPACSSSVAENVAGEMNAWAEGFFGKRIVDDWKTAARLHDEDLPRARAAPRRPPHPRGGRRRLLGLDRGSRALRRQQPRAAAAGRAGRSCSTCRRSKPPRRPRFSTTC